MSTSNLGVLKFAASILCIFGGVAAALFVPSSAGLNLWLGGTLIGVGGQGIISGAIGIKAQDANPKITATPTATSKIP